MTTIPVVEDMARDFTRVLDQRRLDEPQILKAGGKLLSRLVSRDDWLPAAFARPHPLHYQQYLLHGDPLERFCIVSFVWGPGQKTPVHDHTVWGIVGVLRGAELSRRFAPGEPGQPMRCLGEERLDPGCVDYVSPDIGDIHQVSNAHDDRVSISIHLYGADIGRVKRHVYDAQTGTRREFVSGYANGDSGKAAI